MTTDVPRETSDADHEHTWADGRLTDGRPIKPCTTCPRWKLSTWGLRRK